MCYREKKEKENVSILTIIKWFEKYIFELWKYLNTFILKIHASIEVKPFRIVPCNICFKFKF